MSAGTPSFEEAWLEGPHSTNFYTRTYRPTEPPKALLVFLHGFIEHVGRYEHVFPRWAARGIAVFAIDQRGFGRTAEDKEHKSKSSSYAKTCGVDQLMDAEWAVKIARERIEGLPTFLMGHSMGGAIVLAFASSPSAPPAQETLSLLSGIIATSPLIQQTHPTAQVARWAGGKLGALAPYMTVPAKVKADDLSHDPAINSAYLKDPLVKEIGTLRGVSDMLDRGDAVLKQYKLWPESLPLLILHGAADQVTSAKASEEFINNVGAKDKKLSLYPDGFHELHNEPDGVKERVIDECIAWVEAHIPSNTTNAKL